LKHYFGGQNTGVPGCSSDAPTADPLPRIYFGMSFFKCRFNPTVLLFIHSRITEAIRAWRKHEENWPFSIPEVCEISRPQAISRDFAVAKSPRGSAWNCTINFGEVKIRLFTSCDSPRMDG